MWIYPTLVITLLITCKRKHLLKSAVITIENFATGLDSIFSNELYLTMFKKCEKGNWEILQETKNVLPFIARMKQFPQTSRNYTRATLKLGLGMDNSICPSRENPTLSLKLTYL